MEGNYPSGYHMCHYLRKLLCTVIKENKTRSYPGAVFVCSPMLIRYYTTIISHEKPRFFLVKATFRWRTPIFSGWNPNVPSWNPIWLLNSPCLMRFFWKNKSYGKISQSWDRLPASWPRHQPHGEVAKGEPWSCSKDALADDHDEGRNAQDLFQPQMISGKLKLWENMEWCGKTSETDDGEYDLSTPNLLASRRSSLSLCRSTVSSTLPVHVLRRYALNKAPGSLLNDDLQHAALLVARDVCDKSNHQNANQCAQCRNHCPLMA